MPRRPSPAPGSCRSPRQAPPGKPPESQRRSQRSPSTDRAALPPGSFDQALREPGADLKLDLFARSIRRRWEYGADVVAIHRDAATVDRAVRAEVDTILTIRRAGIGRLARSFDVVQVANIDVKRATAILVALTLPEVYLELIDVQGWTPDEFETWLGRSLRQQLRG